MAALDYMYLHYDEIKARLPKYSLGSIADQYLGLLPDPFSVPHQSEVQSGFGMLFPYP